MSARSRSTPWFGTLGDRLEAAETEAREEHAHLVALEALVQRRLSDIVGLYENAAIAMVERYCRVQADHDKWAAELLS